jgi:aspartyl-tRNA(Asn)/glutamyl-tRNA(Gln) amidotransferase subunit A
MTFREWQKLSPEDAAREVHSRVKKALPKAQQKAAIAVLASKDTLAERFKSAPRGTPLGGVPFFAKDLFDFAGVATLAGSTFLEEVRPTPQRDGAFARALKAAGAVFVGKTHLHEFAYGITGENPHYGDCEHPRFPGRTTGGSSSGSAAVVAAEIVPFALGSDTGGSIRVPAAYCGLYGFRTTPGSPWIRDAFPLAPTFDTAGWFTSTADDMHAALGTLANLRTSSTAPMGYYLEFGLLDRDVGQACRGAAAKLAKPATAELRTELLQAFEPSVDAYHTIVSAEAWKTHHDWTERYRNRYDPNVWQRLERAQKVTASQVDTAEVTVNKVRRAWAKFFELHDFLVMPASATPAPTKAECTPEMRHRLLTLTAPASLGGLPTLTIPVALPTGMSAGLQIVAKDPGSPVFAWALAQLR